MTPSVN